MLWFYGPIEAESSGAWPYEIGIEINGQPDFSTPYHMWTTYSILADYGGTTPRRMEISGGEQTLLVQGHYYLRPHRTGSARLLCAGLMPGADATPVADFMYEFWLLKDCNTNGVPDDDEQTGFCCLDFCDPDYNRDGNVDQDDVAYLVDCIASGYCASGRDPDFNHDGNADLDDYTALVNRIGGGDCP